MRTDDVVMFEEVYSIVLMISVSAASECMRRPGGCGGMASGWHAGMSLWMRMASCSFLFEHDTL